MSSKDDSFDNAMLLIGAFLAGLVLISLLPAVLFGFGVLLAARAGIQRRWLFAVNLFLFLIGYLMVLHYGGWQAFLHGYFENLKAGASAFFRSDWQRLWNDFSWWSFFSSILWAGPVFGCLALLLDLFRRGTKSGPRSGSSTRYKEKRRVGLLAKFAVQRLARRMHPPGAVLVGVECGLGRPAIVTYVELNHHLFIVGTSGAGKTVVLLNFAESGVQHGIPAIIVDGKGDIELINKVRRLCQKYGRKFYLFSINGHPDTCRWNPLAAGGPTELKDKLIGTTDWSEPHYKYEAERYLQALFRLLQVLGIKPDLPTIARLLDPDEAKRLVGQISDPDLRAELLRELKAGKTIAGLANRIAVLASSEIGHLFRDPKSQMVAEARVSPAANVSNLIGLAENQPGIPPLNQGFESGGVEAPEVLDLNKAIAEGAAVLFSLNSLRFKEFSQIIGRLIVNDLRTVISRRYDQHNREPVLAIFDEFHVFASLQVVDILNQSRGAGFCTVIATQSLSDLDIVDPNVTARIVENCNTFLIMRQNDPRNAERLASVIGCLDNMARTVQVQETPLIDLPTGLGSLRETKEFIFHPDEVKRLQIGEAILLRKVSGFEVQHILVRKPEI